MNYYIDIVLKPDAEMREHVLLNKVYTKLHKALFELKSNNIGVSFPQWNVRLGNVIRIHGEDGALDLLQKINWLGGLLGYCDISDISLVPVDCKHRVVSRIRPTMSKSKLNRLIKRGSISNQDIEVYKAKMFSRGLENTYVELESSSNTHKHRRYFNFGSLCEIPVSGKFDNFGLSKTATVPWF